LHFSDSVAVQFYWQIAFLDVKRILVRRFVNFLSQREALIISGLEAEFSKQHVENKELVAFLT
jgi:hypothetical protein